MAYFPLFVDLECQPVLVVGGGLVAAHKVRKLLPFGPKITVVSPELGEELAANPDITWMKRSFVPTDVEGQAVVIAATGDSALNGTISTLCRARNIPVNAVDDKHNCTFLFPSLVQEGKLTAGICTAGASPQIASELRAKLAAMVPETMGEILNQMEALREPAKEEIPDPKARRQFLKNAAMEALQQERPLTQEELTEILQQARQPVQGSVTLVGAGCGSYDLITLRGIRAIRQAEVLVYDALVDERLLDFAAESCEKIYVGKRSGSHSMPQEDINALLVKKAQTGARVVRLKGGDPFIFGRGGEELLALKEAGIPSEVIPGISSALAAPELAGIPVTHRGRSNQVHIYTGHTLDGRISGGKTGGTQVFLMGIHHLEEIAEMLLEQGTAPDIPAAVIHVGTKQVKTLRGTLSTIVAEFSKNPIPTPAVLVVGETANLNLTE